MAKAIFKFPSDFSWNLFSSDLYHQQIVSADHSLYAQNIQLIQDEELYPLREKEPFQAIRTAKKYGVTTLIFALDWPALQPAPDHWNENLIDLYRRNLYEMAHFQISPVLILNDTRLPQWFIESGGWLQASAVEIFDRYAQKAANEFGALVQDWITFSQPDRLITFDDAGINSRKRSAKDALESAIHIAEAHALSFDSIHKKRENARVGFTQSITPGKKNEPLLLKGMQSGTIQMGLSRRRIQNDCSSLDFIGVDITFPSIEKSAHRNAVLSMFESMAELSRYQLPLRITSNRFAPDSNGDPDTIADQLLGIWYCQSRGINIQGYTLPSQLLSAESEALIQSVCSKKALDTEDLRLFSPNCIRQLFPE